MDITHHYNTIITNNSHPSSKIREEQPMLVPTLVTAQQVAAQHDEKYLVEQEGEQEPDITAETVYEYYSNELVPALIASFPLLCNRLAADVGHNIKSLSNRVAHFLIPGWFEDHQTKWAIAPNLAQLWEQTLQQENAPQSSIAEFMLGHFDTNGDGHISPSELLNMTEIISRFQPPPTRTFWEWFSREWPLMDWKLGVFIWRSFGGLLVVIAIMSIMPGRLHSFTAKVLRWPVLGLTYFLIAVELMVYVIIRIFIRVTELLVATPRHRALRRKMARAQTFEEWYEYAAQLDASQKRDQWQRTINDKTGYRYNWAFIQELMKDMQLARSKNDSLLALAVLQQCTRKNVGGVMSEELFSCTNTGEPKDIVKRVYNTDYNDNSWLCWYYISCCLCKCSDTYLFSFGFLFCFRLQWPTIDLGGAYGTAKAGQGIMAMGIRSPDLLMKNIIPVVMAGVLGIYGLIVAVILNGKFTQPEMGTGYVTYSQYNGFCHLAVGLCCGLTSLASGIVIGISADAGTRVIGAQSSMAASWKKMGFTGDAGGQADGSGDALFVGTILIPVFASNLGLYGLICALILSQTDYSCNSNGNNYNIYYILSMPCLPTCYTATQYSPTHADTSVALLFNTKEKSLKELWTNNPDTSPHYKQRYALAWVFVGLLRLQFLTLDSPLDPGRAPLAKVQLLNHLIGKSKMDILSLRLDSGFDCGDFSLRSCNGQRIVKEQRRLTEKRSSQEKKVVERISEAPPFYDLFRETRDFQNSIGSLERVLGLVNLIMNAHQDQAEYNILREREVQWQTTTSAFCHRLRSFYSAYEDVTTPLVESVGLIQNAIHLLLQQCMPKQSNRPIEEFNKLVTFPMGDLQKQIDVSLFDTQLHSSIDYIKKLKKGNGCPQAVYIASLCRLAITKHLFGYEEETMRVSSHVLDVIIKSTTGSNELGQEKPSENQDEEEFREQFPNHYRDFEVLLEQIKDDGEDDQEMHSENVENEIVEMTSSDIISFTEEQLSVICLLHRELFAINNTVSTDDFIRRRAFWSAYGAAFNLEKSFNCTHLTNHEREQCSAHVMALGLVMTPSKDIFSRKSITSGLIDFYNDPDPSEAMRASDPLRELIVRTNQLVTAFPGHSILVSVGAVAEKVRKIDILCTPLGKIMTGLEVILKHAQDWEQHASERVRFGKSLQNVQHLVACWRKLELQSWSQLLQSRDERASKKARRYWFRLQQVLQTNDDSNVISTKEESDSSVPKDHFNCTQRWIWKGVSVLSEKLSSPFDEQSTEELIELTKLLDTFILTSPLGEFKERLSMLLSFSEQMRVESSISDDLYYLKFQRARILFSLWSYYNQFIPYLSSKLENLRRPIESRLGDEVKLAKWDEQSYYALVDSTDRNHRKLMKLVAEYDEVLRMNVGSLLQEDFCYGIRSNVDTDDGICTTIPTANLLFPLFKSIEQSGESKLISNHKDMKEKLVMRPEWMCTGIAEDNNCKHLNKMEKYSRRMDTIFSNHDLKLGKWINCGTNSVKDFSDSILGRIESLRAKGTRPMKERALVDLFRELKRNGYVSTKWAIPGQLRQMVSLLQLPSPLKSQSYFLGSDEAPFLEKAESYYGRCLTEINMLRSEGNIMGSKYMSRREITIMQSFAEHGLLMTIQQRSLIFNLLRKLNLLQQYTTIFSNGEKSLPEHQNALKHSITVLRKSFSSSNENLQQLLLLLKTALILLKDEAKANWTRDTIAKLDGILVQNVPSIISVDSVVVVMWSDLKEIESLEKSLQDTLQFVLDCQQESRNLGCLPNDSFDVCVNELKKTVSAASVCTSPSKCSNNTIELNDRNYTVKQFKELVSTTIEWTLLAVQGYASPSSVGNDKSEDKAVLTESSEGDDESIWDSHIGVMKDWANINIQRISGSLSALSSMICEIHDSSHISTNEKTYCVLLYGDLCTLLRRLVDMAKSRLHGYLAFFKNTAKLHYVILRVFRVLIAKGYCSDETSDDGEGEGEGDVSGMTFEDDKDGTGMGEGDGKRDVTDQIENEEQLLGLKGDEEKDGQEKQESKQLDKDEADKGMEMEGDFDGDMYDMPEDAEKNDDDKDDDDGEEELDREMGEDASPDEEVVDEKLWDESDDENDIDKGEEKFEKDSKMTGSAVEDEMRTKDDDDEAETKGEKDDAETHKEAAAEEKQEEKDEGGDTKDDIENEINEDMDDNYEDQHGVDVRGPDVEDEPDNGDENQMELDENLNLDDGDHDDENEVDDDDNIKDGLDADDQPPEDEEGNDDQEGENPEAMETEDGDDKNMDVEDMEHGAQPSGTGVTDGIDDEMKDNDDDEEEEEPELPRTDIDNRETAPEETHGIKAPEGKDAIIDTGENEEENKDSNENDDDEVKDEDADGDETGKANMEPSSSGGGSGEGDGSNETEGAKEESQEQAHDESSRIPNPLQNPGDANKFWHRRLNIVDTNNNQDEKKEAKEGEKDVGNDDDNDKPIEEDPNSNKDGDFEYANQDATTQMLGEVEEEDAVKLDDHKDEEPPEEKKDSEENNEADKPSKDNDESKEQQRKKNNRNREKKSPQVSTEPDHGPPEDDNESVNESVTDMDGDDEESISNEQDGQNDNNCNDNDNDLPKNRVVSDFSKMNMHDTTDPPFDPSSSIIEEDMVTAESMTEVEEAKKHWMQIQADTYSLSRRLCEKLRLVMEPLVASKLRGDYRSGKRINMKRVIGFIASGYRKDKIWLRRTKPAKRNYRVLVAVDDSESMLKSGAGEMALRAMATLAVGMNQLEIGELGVASFGEDMRLLHPFHLPFTSESGSRVVRNFKFNQQRTRTSLCVESAMAALDTPGDQASMQLVFLISDGRIERDSRESLKRLIREMMERNILLAMIIVEGDKDGSSNKKKDSIVNMKEVTFEKGKPVVKLFIEEYPFPYYIVLDDMLALPEVLGDALRQWFEMLSQLQTNR